MPVQLASYCPRLHDTTTTHRGPGQQPNGAVQNAGAWHGTPERSCAVSSLAVAEFAKTGYLYRANLYGSTPAVFSRHPGHEPDPGSPGDARPSGCPLGMHEHIRGPARLTWSCSSNNCAPLGTSRETPQCLCR